MIIDNDSVHFLICKKIAQLVKLINHLYSVSAENERGIELINQSAENSFNELTKNHHKLIQNITDQADSMMANSSQIISHEFEKKYQIFFHDYQEAIVSVNESMTEVRVVVKSSVANMHKIINTINSNLNSLIENISSFSEQRMKNVCSQIQKLDKKHRDEIKILEEEEDIKLSNLEKQTNLKLDELERDFNRSLSGLSQKFGYTKKDDEGNEQYQLRQSQTLATKILKTKRDICEIRESCEVLINSYKQIIFSLKSALTKEISKLIEYSNSFPYQKYALKEKIQNEDKKYLIEIQNYQESKIVDDDQRKKEILKIKKDYNSIQAGNIQKIEDFKITNKTSQNDTKGEICHFLKKLTETLKLTKIEQEQERKKYETLFYQTQKEIDHYKKDIESSEKVLRLILENHKIEVDHYKSSYLKLVKDLRKQNQFRINEIWTKHNESVADLPITKEINKNKEIFDMLYSEKERILNKFSEEKRNCESFIESLKTKSSEENIEIKTKLENDMKDVRKQDNLMISAVSDSHRNEVFLKNNELARNYDNYLNSIRKYYSNDTDYKVEINRIYLRKQNELKKEFKSLKIPKKDSSYEIDLSKYPLPSKKDALEKIELEKSQLQNNFKELEIEEIERHKSEMKRIGQLNEKSILLITKEEFDEKFRELNKKIFFLNENLQKQKQFEKRDLSKSIIVFDQEEKEIKEKLLNAEKEYNDQIENAHKNIEKQRKSIIKEMEIFYQKVKKTSSAVKRKNEEIRHEIEKSIKESKEKSLHILEKLVSDEKEMHENYLVVKNRMEEKHIKKIESLKESIENQVNERESMTLESLEEKCKTNIQNLEKQFDLVKKKLIKENEKMINKFSEIFISLEKRSKEIEQKKSIITECLQNNVMREDEQSIIERLENQLKIVDQYAKDVSFELVDYRKKLVHQEGIYNSQFGNTHTIGVLRPKTGYGSANSRVGIRCGTAAASIRPKSFLKNRANVYA